MIPAYTKSSNGKKIIILYGDRESFRCRQRNKINGYKVKPLQFVSFKEMEKEIKKNNFKVLGPYYFNTLSKL